MSATGPTPWLRNGNPQPSQSVHRQPGVAEAEQGDQGLGVESRCLAMFSAQVLNTDLRTCVCNLYICMYTRVYSHM